MIAGHHDVGGTRVEEPIAREGHALLPWEVRVDALMWILTDPARPGGRRMSVDELRRGIEELPAEEYRSRGYFEKWLLSMVATMTRKGAIDGAALERRVAEVTRAYENEHAREHEHGPS
ncbi:MAG TPA: hypothetical protein VKG44_08670 [Candidatus Baltobacteraceae bacterium]|nr:hypothetical protein [Candidatus Baltobacteraceae bacterium]